MWPIHFYLRRSRQVLLRKAGVVDVVVVGDGFEKSSALNLGSTNFIRGGIPSSHLYAVQSTMSRTIN